MKEFGKRLVHVRLKAIPEKEPAEISPPKEVRETETRHHYIASLIVDIVISIPFHVGKTFLSSIFQHLVPFSLSKHITKLLQRAPIQLSLLPQIRCKEAVGITHRHEGRFEGVFESFCGAG